MKTLVILSHPSLEDSNANQFLQAAAKSLEQVTWHHLEQHYPMNQIDVEAELSLLKQADRLIFQFPFYWYSTPALLKAWQDQVLEKANQQQILQGKTFGIVVTSGVAEKEYQAGGKEKFTLSELLRPLQQMAYTLGMKYLPPFMLAQFLYQEEQVRLQKLVEYQQYLTLEGSPSLIRRSRWIMEQLKDSSLNERTELSFLLEAMETNLETIEELTDTLQMIKEEDQ